MNIDIMLCRLACQDLSRIGMIFGLFVP